MNRRERRAAAKHAASARAHDPGARKREVNGLLAEALRHQQQRDLQKAVLAYKRLLALEPDHAEGVNNLACVLREQGKTREASAHFARALALAPQVFDNFPPICATLAALLPPFAAAMKRAVEAWPERPPLPVLLDGAPLASIAADPLLLTILRSSPVRELGCERALTAIRAALLDVSIAEKPVEPAVLGFAEALAEQCFINEYVFATTADEEARISELTRTIEASIASGASIRPMHIAIAAMYMPLLGLAGAAALLEKKWPQEIANLLRQQIREPQQELALRDSIPRLTPIADQVSQRVRQQYEDNPYPRWVHLSGATKQQPLENYLSEVLVGTAPPLAFGDTLDILVAGSGTGSHPIDLAREIAGARVLAIDLSLGSLAYAKRKTPPDVADRLEYAQADILQLGELGRSFDVIDSAGVLHHMADPAAGLRVLAKLLRPKGLMRLGLYSQTARIPITAARKYLAEHGYQSTVADIRRARQDLIASDLRAVAQSNDFYTTSECRDLLFHVQEHQLTIPQIKSLLAEHGLRFLGFVFDPVTGRGYAQALAQAGRSPADLDAWHAFELQRPDTFRAMYQFWCQKL